MGSRRPATTALLVAEVAAIVAVCAPALLGLVRKAGSIHHLWQPVDFAVYLDAARHLNQGLSPYASDYIYPPLFAGLLRPLALLPLEAAGPIWAMVNVAAAAALVWAFVRAAGLGRRGAVAAAAGFVLLPATYDTILLGQLNLVVAALVMGCVALLVQPEASPRQQQLAGALLGLAAALKVFPLLFAIPLWLLRRRDALTGVGVTFAGATLLGVVIGGGVDSTAMYWQEVLPRFAGGDHARIENQSLVGGCLRLLSVTSHEFPFSLTGAEAVAVQLRPLLDAPGLARVLGRALAGAVLAASLAVCVLLRRRGPDQQDLHLALAVMVGGFLLAGTVVWNYYYGLLAVPLSLLIRGGHTGRRAIRAGCYAAAALVIAHRFWIPLAFYTQLAVVTVFGMAGVAAVWLLLLSTGARRSRGGGP